MCDKTFLLAELDEIVDDHAFCWLEIVEGQRVRISIHVSELGVLDIWEGDQFLWSPTNRVARPIQVDKEREKRLDEMERRFAELEREYREIKERGS